LCHETAQTLPDNDEKGETEMYKRFILQSVALIVSAAGGFAQYGPNAQRCHNLCYGRSDYMTEVRIDADAAN
jgi:hypothetical protein